MLIEGIIKFGKIDRKWLPAAKCKFGIFRQNHPNHLLVFAIVIFCTVSKLEFWEKALLGDLYAIGLRTKTNKA